MTTRPSFKKAASRAIAAAAFLAALISGAANDARAQQKQLKVRGSYEHINGVNLPWMTNSAGSNYSHDIGGNYYYGTPAHYSHSDVDSYYADIKNMHANIVRVWLFEDLQGFTFDSNGYVNGLDPTFLSNLKDMVQTANNHGLALELTLLNNNLAAQVGHYPAWGGGAVKNIMTDSGAQSAFLNIVKQLAQTFNNNYGVYGYDLMNECNYAVTGLNGTAAACTWPQMHNYIYNAAQVIHGVNSSIQVTCSTDDANSFATGNFYNRVGGVGLNYYDYHNYSDNPNLFSLGSGGPYPQIDKPIVLAEYGAQTTGNWTIQNNVLGNYINQASYLNWAGASAWSYDATGQSAYTLVYGIGNWHSAAWTLQWYSINKFGL